MQLARACNCERAVVIGIAIIFGVVERSRRNRGVRDIDRAGVVDLAVCDVECSIVRQVQCDLVAEFDRFIGAKSRRTAYVERATGEVELGIFLDIHVTCFHESDVPFGICGGQDGLPVRKFLVSKVSLAGSGRIVKGIGVPEACDGDIGVRRDDVAGSEQEPPGADLRILIIGNGPADGHSLVCGRWLSLVCLACAEDEQIFLVSVRSGRQIAGNRGCAVDLDVAGRIDVARNRDRAVRAVVVQVDRTGVFHARAGVGGEFGLKRNAGPDGEDPASGGGQHEAVVAGIDVRAFEADRDGRRLRCGDAGVPGKGGTVVEQHVLAGDGSRMIRIKLDFGAGAEPTGDRQSFHDVVERVVADQMVVGGNIADVVGIGAVHIQDRLVFVADIDIVASVHLGQMNAVGRAGRQNDVGVISCHVQCAVCRVDVDDFYKAGSESGCGNFDLISICTGDCGRGN